MTSVIYYTDGSLPEDFAALLRRHLLKAANGFPIISVTQTPLNFGTNICVGLKPRTHLSMYQQILAGIEAATTDTIALAEHDCLYTLEHIGWTPPDPEVFYYNVNHWFLQWNGRREGQFSYQRRRVLSNLVVGREIALIAVREKVWMLEHGYMIKKGVAGACEPGCIPLEEQMVKVPTDQMMRASLPCEPGVCENRAEYVAALAEFKDLGKEIGRYRAEAFRTREPNVDIRHGLNFSGGRRGADTRMALPPWGTLEDIKRG